MKIAGALVTVTLAISLLFSQAAAPLKVLQKIPLSNVAGRIDHLAVDLQHDRLFVAALGNNTVEVLDLKAGQRTSTITGLKEPQGVVFVPDSNRLFVAGGGDGTCRVFDGTSLAQIAAIRFGSDADNLRYDPETKKVYVGYGDGGIAAVDAVTLIRAGDIRLDGHPESFQLERSGKRIFVNVPSARRIEVVDRIKSVRGASWPVEQYESNFPMALDEPDHRLFVGTRRPAALLVLDTIKGTRIAAAPCSKDADDLFYDARNRSVYVACGEGFLDVFRQQDADHYALLARIPTAPGARTCLFAAEKERLYLAVPHRGTETAGIWVYGTGP